MPHIIIKLHPGRTEAQKQAFTDAIVQAAAVTLQAGAETLSVAFEEIASTDWEEKVYKPDILGKHEQLTKKPGYTMP